MPRRWRASRTGLLILIDHVEWEPSIRIFPQKSPSNRYLYDIVGSITQVSGDDGKAIGLIDDETFWLPQSAIDLIDSNERLHFLLEGVTRGEATLALVLKVNNDEFIVPSVHLKLDEVRKMYEHRRCFPDWNSESGSRSHIQDTVSRLYDKPQLTQGSKVYPSKILGGEEGARLLIGET